MVPSPETPFAQWHPLSGFVSSKVRSVEFQRNNVVLRFDNGLLSVGQPYLELASKRYVWGAAGYRDALCARIGRRVLQVSTTPEVETRLRFDDGASLVNEWGPARGLVPTARRVAGYWLMQAGFWVATALTLPFLWLWCKLAEWRNETRRPESPAEMVALLRRHIGPGTPVGEAEEYLERHGFKCGRVTDFTWREDNPEYWSWIWTPIEHRDGERPPQRVERVKGADMVIGRRATVTPTWFIGEVWQVGLVHSGGVVTEIYADRWFDGP